MIAGGAAVETAKLAGRRPLNCRPASADFFFPVRRDYKEAIIKKTGDQWRNRN
jgi:hypothetical protein